MWPYNAYYPLNASGPNGHIGNACGHTALARILHYWQHPVNGEGILDFNDFFGNHWYVDLENLDLDYGQMPAMLNWGDPETVYGETARLFLACGALGEKINIGFTDGIFRLPDALNTYMRFSNNMEVKQRWDFTREEWIAIFKNELEHNRPILIDGRTPSSPAPWEPGSWQGHYFVCDGYNAAEEFHINYMFGGIQGYYDIDSMATYSAYHRIIVNMEPINVGIGEMGSGASDGMRVYPNPASGSFYLSFSGKPPKEGSLRVCDLQGRTVRDLVFRDLIPGEVLQINTQSLPPGVYSLHFSAADQHFVQKVMLVE